MVEAVFIGDEATAAGYRLAGLRILQSPPGEAVALLRRAREEAELVLIGAAAVSVIGEAELAAAQAAGKPLVAVVPDVSHAEPPDLAAAVSRAFGLEL